MNDVASHGPTLAYLVLRCRDLEKSLRFYEILGVTFVMEQHGAGAKHYAGDLGGVVLELYPQSSGAIGGTRIGLQLTECLPSEEELVAAGGLVKRWNDDSVVVCDPDGHVLDISLGQSRRGEAG